MSTCPNCGYVNVSTRRELIPEIVHNLQALRPDRARLDWYLHQLHDVGGYTLESLAYPLGISRERVRQRARRAKPVEGVPPVEPPPPPERIEPPPPPPPVITDEVAQELGKLQADATRLRGRHGPDHPYRVAAETLAHRINELHADGATYRELGAVLGVKQGTVRRRLAYYGYRSTPPSQGKYQGKVAR